MIDWDEHHRENCYRAEFPTKGDYWEEMMSGQYLVVAVTPSLVAVCQDKVEVDDDHWRWDTSKCTVYTREQFSDLVRYSTPTMRDKTWCSCHPGALIGDAEEAKDAAIKAIAAYKKVAKPSMYAKFVARVRAALKVRLLAWGNAL